MVCVVQTYDPPHPTYPLVRDITTGNDGGTAGTSHTVTLPTGIDVGERLIVMFATRENNVTFPAGWTELYDAGNSGQSCQAGAYRDCDGTEGASIAVTTGTSRACAWQVWRLSRGNFIAGVAPEVGTVASGNSANPNPPSETPSWGAQNTLWIATASLKDNPAPSSVSSWPTNYADNRTSVTAVANNLEIYAASRTLNASSEDPGTYTMANSRDWASQTIAVRLPAS